MRWRRWLLAVAIGSAVAAAAAPCAGAQVPQVPVQPGSPWPTMRHDRRNTGASPIVGGYHGDRPWAYRTGKGIFSTPVVGGNGTIFAGSADDWFYALSPRGRLVWRFRTGNLIDSAGFVGAWSPAQRTYPVAVPSGDTYLYMLRSDARLRRHVSRVIWRYTPPAARSPLGEVPLVNWWEGNAEPGPDGTIYAGSTGDAAYALHPDGTLKWVHRSIAPFWTDPAIALDNTTYWGSLDLQVHAFAASGHQLWNIPTLGFITSSPALANDGTLYIGSFDSDLYALDARTGLVRWKFATSDHIYSSPALDEDALGHTSAIIIASTDGRVYAVSPTGRELWAYDTGDVIRSSPVIGIAPDGVHKIVYVGAGNGTLYALNASDGTRRWSFDTTRADDPILRDRNDLNGSPALTRTGVVIGGEDGYLKYVPYDYCLHVADSRCSTDPGQAFPAEETRVYPVTAGGDTELSGAPATVGAATVLPGRLVVRHGGATVDASIQPLGNAAGLVQASPAFPFTAQVSGDGHYVYVIPDGFLAPGSEYSVRLHGLYTAGGLAVGNLHVLGTSAGTFDQTLTYRVAPITGQLPLSAGRDSVSAMRMTRLAFPLPAFLTSVNQIGFDAYDLIVGTIRVTPPAAGGPGSLLLWAVGARPGPGGVEEVDPGTPLAFPLAGRYLGNSLALSGDGATLTFSFGPVPVQRFELRAQLSPALVAQPGAFIYAEAACLSVPTYGPLLPTQRLCNNQGKVISSGTFVTSRYAAAGTANRRPAGVGAGPVVLRRPTPVSAGSAAATLTLAPGAGYPADRHFVAIVLTDAITGAAVGLDYKARTTEVTNARGDITGVRLSLPAGTELPARIRAYVIADVFPLSQSAA